MTAIPVSERVNWVGASEVAALFGASPYQTLFEIWHQKAGNIPPANLDGDERVQAGQFLEPAIARWAASKWPDWSPRPVGYYIAHPSVDGMGCSLDFEDAASDGPDEARPPIEIKNVDSLIFRDQWAAEGDEIVDAPLHILIQVQHQLACRPQAPHGWILACVGGNRLYRMRVERHPNMIAAIETGVADFWRSVREGRAPRPDFQADAEVIGRLYAAQGERLIDLTDSNRAPELCAEYLDAHQAEKAGKARKSAAMAELKTLMDGASIALIAGGFQVKAAHVRGGTYEREPHWRYAVTQKKER